MSTAAAYTDDLAGPSGRASTHRLIGAWDFVSSFADIERGALWGRDDLVLWPPGESLWISGPPGVGKTSLAQRLVLARLGIPSNSLLGFPVAIADRPVLYVSADRPKQAARSLRRMVTDADAAVINQLMLIWPGPPVHDVGAPPEQLRDWALSEGAGTIVLDSLKDVALDLSKEETGARVNRALQLALMAGIEVIAVHHTRKATGENRTPNKLADVYGSTWLTAGAGSVIMLWGEQGAPVMDLLHVKQPATEVWPPRAGRGPCEGGLRAAARLRSAGAATGFAWRNDRG